MDSNSNKFVGSIVIPEYKFLDFEDITTIDKGGEATVYKGRHVTEKKYFAIKKIHKMNPKETQLLIEHSKHENIVKVYGLLIEEDPSKNLIGYFMEFMENGSLNSIIHNPEIKYNMRQFYLWIRQAAKGLNYLHRNKIIHRDIKPGNLLLGKSLDELKISDFGIAKTLDPLQLTSNTSEIGTVFYMSPEVITSRKYKFPSDIYALSITIWEMFHRKEPYVELAHKSLYWFFKQIAEENKRPAISGDSSLTKLLGRGWDADPDKRPDLREFINFARINLEESDTSQILCVGTDPETVQPSREQIKNSVMILGGFLCDDCTDSICIFNSKQNKWNDLYLRLPRKLAGHGSAIINDEIYIFGGCEGQEYFKELYKLGGNMEWIQLADMNEKRAGIGNSFVVFDDEIWVFGGFNGARLKSVEKYNSQTNTWTVMPEMNQGKYLSAVSIVSGKFYVTGGYNGWSTLKTIEVYDPEEEEWDLFCEMPIALGSHVSVADGTNLIIIGGRKSFYDSSNEVWKINVLDPEKKWIKMSNLNQKRYHHSAIKLSDGLMVIGGVDDSRKIIDTLEIFDGRKWRERKVKYSNCRSRFSLIPLTTKNEVLFLQRDNLLKRLKLKKLLAEGSIMILGGKSKGYLKDSIYIYNSKETKWNKMYLKLPRYLSGHVSVIINDEIYIFGGCEGQEHLKELYKLGENMEWIKLADMNEKRAGIGNSSVVFDDEIWVFGGENETNCLKSVEKYNLQTNTWTVMLEMNQEKCLSAVSIINGKFYVSGGFDGKNPLKTIEFYDPKEKEWELFCEMPIALHMHASILDGTNLIIIGGDKSRDPNQSDPSDEVWKIDVLDPEKKWIKMPNLQQARYNHSAIKLPDGLMVIGGKIDYKTPLDSVEIFGGNKWTEGNKLPEKLTSFSLIQLTLKE